MLIAVIGLLAAFIASAICILVHLQGLRWLLYTVQHGRRRFRHPLQIVLFVIFTLHLLEVMIYAAVIAIVESLGFGTLAGAVPTGADWFIDHIYFSLAAYTTLGLGDIVPHGAIRLITGVEALNGLLLVAWSATFTYLMMERLWTNDLPKDADGNDDLPTD